jgi:transcriptional regulator with XRE-family HTH domain
VSTQHVVTRADIAKSIKSHREAKGWSRNELGRRAGIGCRNIAYWERERGEPDITAFVKLASALDISLDELAGLT